MSDAPYLAMAFFCERIEEDERGLKTFINSIDTLGFNLKHGEALSQSAWAGMLALEVTFGEFEGPIDIEMTQVEVATGERNSGLRQRIDTADFPGMLALSLSIDFRVAYEREGDYRYEFFLNGEKRAETSLRVRAVRE